MTSTPRSFQTEEKDLGPDDSISMVSTSTVSGSESCTINLRTPTSSSASTSIPNRSNNVPYITRNSAPGPGSTYIIVNESGGENKALTVVGGYLHLATPPELLPNPPVLDPDHAKAFAGTCNWHWHCKESDGWLGFRNAATGQWLGSSCIGVEEGGTIIAVVLDTTRSFLGGLEVNQQFCVRKAADDEGYVLLKRVDLSRTVHLLPVKTVSVRPIMGLASSNLKTTDVERRRLTWEFVKVDVDLVSGGRIQLVC